MAETLLTFLQTLVLPEKRHYRSGAYLFHPGEEAVAIFGLKSGQMRMSRFNEAGDEIVLYRAGPTETLAEAALFSETYHCAVIAETDCEILAFSKQRVLAVLDRDPRLFRQYCALLSRQVRDLRALLEVRSIRGAEDRVLHFLRQHATGDGKCECHGTLMEMAGQLGLAHETLYRSLTRLEKAGSIRRQGKDIFV